MGERRRTVVVKVGGATLGGGVGPALSGVLALRDAEQDIVVVHGGGPEITRWAGRVGLTTRFVAGLRYSDADTVAVAEMALARVGKQIAAALTAAGVPALSLGGRDAGVLTARPLQMDGPDGRALDLGLVGEVAGVRVEVLRALLGAGLVPVLGSVAAGDDGELYNINADDAAADVAAALGADALCLCTDVPGILVPGAKTPLVRCDARRARALIAEGVVTGGMRPKVEACLRALAAGVGATWILDGRREGAVLAALSGEEGAGTALVSAESSSAGTGRGQAATSVAAASMPPATSAGQRPVGGRLTCTAAGQMTPALRITSATRRVMDLDARYVVQTYGRAPILLEHGYGASVWDGEGRQYLDFLCGISVTNVGHCHPKVVEAVQRQAACLGHVSNLYYTQPQAELAEALVEASFPGRVFFCNSGTEANEAALKLARKAAWRRSGGAEPDAVDGEGAGSIEIVSFAHAFHGRSYGSLAATRGYQQGFGPMLPGFREAPWNDVAAAEAVIGPQTCGVIVEPVQGEGGVRVASREFLQRLRALCDRYRACLIFDEVQCGLGRVGRLFAFQHFGVRPDVMTLGKALGAGLPMGGIIASEAWSDALRRGDHASTFGGNPIVAAAGLAGFRVLSDAGYLERAVALGDAMRADLRERLRPLGCVREVRGLGMMTGVDLEAGGPDGQEVVRRCREAGLLINCTSQTVLRVMPPLCVTESEVEQGNTLLTAALQAEADGSRAK